MRPIHEAAKQLSQLAKAAGTDSLILHQTQSFSLLAESAFDLDITPVTALIMPIARRYDDYSEDTTQNEATDSREIRKLEREIAELREQNKKLNAELNEMLL